MPRRRSPMPARAAAADPAVDLAFQHLQDQMPEESARVRKIAPMTLLDRLMLPADSQAASFPWGTIRYRPEYFATQSQGQIDDLLAHELVHQGQAKGWIGRLLEPKSKETYYEPLSKKQLPIAEKPAYEMMKQRATKRRDIDLPARRKE